MITLSTSHIQALPQYIACNILSDVCVDVDRACGEESVMSVVAWYKYGSALLQVEQFWHSELVLALSTAGATTDGSAASTGSTASEDGARRKALLISRYPDAFLRHYNGLQASREALDGAKLTIQRMIEKFAAGVSTSSGREESSELQQGQHVLSLEILASIHLRLAEHSRLRGGHPVRETLEEADSALACVSKAVQILELGKVVQTAETYVAWNRLLATAEYMVGEAHRDTLTFHGFEGKSHASQAVTHITRAAKILTNVQQFLLKENKIGSLNSISGKGRSSTRSSIRSLHATISDMRALMHTLTEHVLLEDLEGPQTPALGNSGGARGILIEIPLPLPQRTLLPSRPTQHYTRLSYLLAPCDADADLVESLSVRVARKNGTFDAVCPPGLKSLNVACVHDANGRLVVIGHEDDFPKMKKFNNRDIIHVRTTSDSCGGEDSQWVVDEALIPYHHRKVRVQDSSTGLWEQGVVVGYCPRQVPGLEAITKGFNDSFIASCIDNIDVGDPALYKVRIYSTAPVTTRSERLISSMQVPVWDYIDVELNELLENICD